MTIKNICLVLFAGVVMFCVLWVSARNDEVRNIRWDGCVNRYESVSKLAKANLSYEQYMVQCMDLNY